MILETCSWLSGWAFDCDIIIRRLTVDASPSARCDQYPHELRFQRYLRLQSRKNTQLREEVLDSSELKKAGLKVTLPRVKILEIIETNPDWHMSAEDVYKELLARGEEIGLATVYRVLTQFETADILKRHQFEGGKAVFELISKGDHDHLVCVKTGQVEEFHDPVIQERIANIADEFDFDLTDYSLVIYGISRKATGKK